MGKENKQPSNPSMLFRSSGRGRALKIDRYMWLVEKEAYWVKGYDVMPYGKCLEIHIEDGANHRDGKIGNKW